MTETYRGWTIENLGHRRGWWGYAPDYDGADPKQTQSGSTRDELRAQIDCTIEEYPYLQRCSHDWAALIPHGVRSVSFADAMADKRAVCTQCGATQDGEGDVTISLASICPRPSRM